MNVNIHEFGHAFRSVVAVVVVGLLAGCTAGTLNPNIVRGSGNVINESRQVSGLNEVVLTMSGDLTIEQNGTEALTIEGEDNIVPLITTEVTGNRLTISTKGTTGFSTTKPLRFQLSVKDLAHIRASGSGNISMQGLNSDRLGVETTGSGDITAKDIAASTVTARTSGSGNIVVAGKAESLDITGTGSGNYMGRDLQSKSAKVVLSGSGDATVRVSDTLDATVSGSGSVRYIGDPTVTRHDSSSGEIVQVKQ